MVVNVILLIFYQKVNCKKTGVCDHTCRLLHVIVSGSIEVKGVPIEAIENPEENREEDQEESIEPLKQKFGLISNFY